MSNRIKRIREFFLHILGPKKSIQQHLQELEQGVKKNGRLTTTLQQAGKLPVEGLKLVWNKDKDKK